MVFFLDLISLVAAVVATLALNVASFVCRCIHRHTSSIWWFIHQTISPMLVASFLSVLGWVLLPMQQGCSARVRVTAEVQDGVLEMPLLPVCDLHAQILTQSIYAELQQVCHKLLQA